MAKVIHTCTGCVPIDASIIEAYVALLKANQEANEAEAERKSAESERESTFEADHEASVAATARANEAAENAEKVGKYYGFYLTAADLPSDATDPGYAMVGATSPFAIYDFDGVHWADSGATLDSIEGPQGEPGTGITSVEQTTSSSESEGDNIITVTLTDGTAATFTVKNGKRGLQGPPGVANAKYKQVAALPTASAATMDFIYLVESATSGVYDMSYTEEDGGAYSWISLGTTAIQLTDYVTQAEFIQLEAKVGDVTYQETKVTSFTWTSTVKYIYGQDGSVWNDSTLRYCTIPVSGAKKVRFPGPYTQSSETRGFGFYDENGNVLSSETFKFGADSTVVKEYIVDVPENAATFKCTSWNSRGDGLPLLYTDFYCYLITGESVMDEVDKIDEGLNGTGKYYGYETGKDTLIALPHIIGGKQLKIPAAGTALSNVTTANGANYRNARVPVSGAVRVEYNSYSSTAGYGSMFVDSSDKVISGKAKTSSDTNPIELDVPSNAKYFIFSYTVGNSPEFNHITVYFPAEQLDTDKISDNAITTQKIADGAVTGAKIADGAVADNITEIVLGKNLLNLNASDYIQGAYINTSGSLVQNSSTTDVDMSGKIPFTQEQGYLTLSYNGGNFNRAWYENIVYYDENGDFLSATPYTIDPVSGIVTATWSAGVGFVRFALRHYEEDVRYYQVEVGQAATSFEPYSAVKEFSIPSLAIPTEQIKDKAVTSGKIADGAVTQDKIAPGVSFPSMIPALSLCGLNGEDTTKATVTSETLVLSNWPKYTKASAIVSVDAQITAFNTIYVGIGSGYIRGRYVKIDATNIYFGHSNTSPETIDKTSAHGLSIGTFIKVIFIVDGLKSTVIVSTIDGVFKDEKTLSDTDGNRECYGPPYLKVDASTTFTDVKLNANCEKYKLPVWIFGDSMASEFSNRWPYYTRYQWGFDYYLDALAGGTSAELFSDLEKALEHGTPKYLVWMLGANDLLNNNISAYKNYVQQVETLCAAKGVELILLKLPCFPDCDTTSANTWMVALGHRYIDFYKAVGSDSSGNWYAGYMDEDQRHPTTLGAKAEASQMCVDFPEIMQYRP